MFTTYCAAHACKEKLPCAGKENPVCVAVTSNDTSCSEPECPCWSYTDPPLSRIVSFIKWHLTQLAAGKKFDYATEFALGKSAGWLSLEKGGSDILTDEEVVTYVRQLTQAFEAGLSHSNPRFFEEGGSFLGSASSHRFT